MVRFKVATNPLEEQLKLAFTRPETMEPFIFSLCYPNMQIFMFISVADFSCFRTGNCWRPHTGLHLKFLCSHTALQKRSGLPSVTSLLA